MRQIGVHGLQGSCTFSHGSFLSAGVAVLLRKNANVTILSSTEVVKGRLLNVRAEIDSSVLCFINIYAPNQGTERVGFFTLLKNEVRKYHQDQFMTGGDFRLHFRLYFRQDKWRTPPTVISEPSQHHHTPGSLRYMEGQISTNQTVHMGEGQQ